MRLLEQESMRPDRATSPMASRSGGALRLMDLSPDFANSPVDAAIRRGEREKQLEILLQKTKRDKDKAIRLIVQIVGKDRISAFLSRHAGAPDILDKLLEYFAMGLSVSESPQIQAQSPISSTNRLQSTARTSSTRGSAVGDLRSPSPRKAANPKSPAHYRSRIDEYYRTVITGRDL